MPVWKSCFIEVLTFLGCGYSVDGFQRFMETLSLMLYGAAISKSLVIHSTSPTDNLCFATFYLVIFILYFIQLWFYSYRLVLGKMKITQHFVSVNVVPQPL